VGGIIISFTVFGGWWDEGKVATVPFTTEVLSKL